MLMPPSSFESANNSGRITDGNDICGKVTNHNRAGTDHRVLTDRDPRTDDHATAQPDIVHDHDGPRGSTVSTSLRAVSFRALGGELLKHWHGFRNIGKS